MSETILEARPTATWTRAAGARLRRLCRRYLVELLWLVFALANYAAMIAWPSWETIPFHFVWISLTLLYGFRVWSRRPTLVLLAGVMAMTGASIGLDAFRGIQLWGELFEVPLMAAMFVAMVWHARRRVEAQRVAEQRAEERQSLLERQERFVNDASHELRTPLTIARGHLELLRAGAAEHPAGEVDVALDELGRIDAIIERLLVLATAGQPDFVRPAEVDLEPLLEEVVMRWSGVAPRSWRLGPVAAGRLFVDAERLRVALDALLENAVKYSSYGAAIELRARAAGPAALCIEVADEGCGVPEAALPHVFERFARADSARTRTEGGAGLGLAIVDAIVRAHGGQCAVDSSPAGSTFALRLPGFSPARATPPHVSGSAPGGLAAPGHGRAPTLL